MEETFESNRPMLTAFFNYIGEITIPAEIVEHAPKSGSYDSYIRDVIETDIDVQNVLNNIDASELVRELQDYGTWSYVELADHESNKERILWIAIMEDIWENEF